MTLNERSKAIEAVLSVAPGTICRGQAIIAAICALPAASVSDEMLDRAIDAHVAFSDNQPFTDAMRAAIEAAMGHSE